jgi:hypothetical protein
LIFDQLSVDIVQLRNTDSGRLSNIRVLVFQTLTEWLTQVLGDLVDTNTSHCSYSEGTDQRIAVLAVLKMDNNFTIITDTDSQHATTVSLDTRFFHS